MATIGDVFVPGGLPSITYVPRDRLNLETTLRDYLEERLKILSLSGPTKSGKTVLLKTVVFNAIWVSGGDIRTAEEFWEHVAEDIGVYTEESKEVAREATDRKESIAKGGIDLQVVNVGGERGTGTEDSETRTHARSRSRSPSRAAQQDLRITKRPVIVDDFHYLAPEVQLEIVRGLKSIVFDGVPVIFASVPHRAFDAVRVEKEMTGRVEQLSIPFWSEADLEKIAISGFRALNVSTDERNIARLARESFGSPHLMQDFSKEFCRTNNVRATQEERRVLREPDWDEFFRQRASSASKAAFDLLARGPRQRTDRKPRTLKTGATTDIYGAVLAAIAATGPATELPYERLRTSLRNVLADEPPRGPEVTRVLEEMNKIARDQIEGEPVVDYDAELNTLYIWDPFFAYFLRWGMNGKSGSADDDEE